MILFGKKIPVVFSLAIWFIVWELVGQAKLSTIIPPFSDVLAAGFTIVPTEKFNKAVWISLRSFAVGMVFALMIGIPAGVLMARVQVLGKILGMWVDVFVSAPISALVPILMAVIGIGETTIVVTVFLFAVFVIILDTQVGVKQADRSLVEMARSFGATRQQLYAKVLLLSALPEILAGLRLAAIRGVKGVVIGQLVVAIVGVGELFELYSQHFLMEEFWALVIIVFLFAFAVSEAIAFLERRVEYYSSSR
jgi:NitT/TauT family transport system permease protein